MERFDASFPINKRGAKLCEDCLQALLLCVCIDQTLAVEVQTARANRVYFTFGALGL
jgi:hypothetical protein